MADLTRRIVLELLARNKAAGELALFSRSIDGVYHSARRLAGGLLAMAGIGGLGYMIKQQMEAVHETTNLAARLGMTTEALVGLQHAAKLTDVEQEQLTRSLDFFNRTLGDAQMGSTSAAKAFTAIGISFKDLAGLNPEQKIGMVADQINKLGTQSQKAATVQDIFGRGSQALLGLLSEGSKGIAAYRLETEKLGLSFSQVDAAKVEMAIESLTRMRAVFTGLFRRTAIELAPYIEAAAQAFVDWATAGEGVGHNVTSAFEMMTKGAVRFGAELQEIGNRWLEMKATAFDVRALWERATVAGRVSEFIREKRNIISPADQAAIYRDQKTNTEGQINAVEQFYANLRKEAEQRAAVARRYISVSDIPWAGTPEIPEKLTADQMKDVVTTTRDAIDSIRHMDGLTRMERIENLRTYAAANAEMLGQVEEANRALNNEILTLERSRLDAMKVYNAEMRERMQEPYLAAMDYAADFTKSTEGSWKGFWDPVIDGSKTASQAIDDFFRNLAINFAQLQAQKAMMSIWDAVLGSALSAAATGAFGALGGGGGAGLAPSPEGGTMPVKYHQGGMVGRDGIPTRMVDPGVFAHAPRLHSGLASDEFPAILQQGERVFSRSEVSRGGSSSNQRLESLMGQVVSLLSQRQTINLSAKVVDSRDVVTGEQMEGRRGEKFVMRHVGRNS